MGPKRKEKSYMDTMLTVALKAMEEEGLLQQAAAKQFRIPKENNPAEHKAGRNDNHKKGPQGVLTKEEETFFITNYLKFPHKTGMPKEEDDILADIAEICVKNWVGDKYKDFVPMHSWLTKFCMWNKNILSWQMPS